MRILVIAGWIIFSTFVWLFALLEIIRLAMWLSPRFVRLILGSMGIGLFAFGIVGLSTLIVIVTVAMLALHGRLPGTRRRKKAQPSGFAVVAVSKEESAE